MLLRTSLSLLLAVSVFAAEASRREPPLPGPQGGGVTLLPNGARIAPAGRHLTVGDLPLAMAESPDGRYLIVSNDGYAKATLEVVDLAHFTVASRFHIDDAWLGLAWHPDGRRLYSSGGGANTARELTFSGGRLTSTNTSWVLGRSDKYSFVGGVAVSPDGRWLYAVHALGERLSQVDLVHDDVRKSVELPAEAYACALSADGRTLFVSLWGGARVLLFDAVSLAPQGEIAVGEHPSALALSRDGARLFVACANTNAVWVVDLAARKAAERISVAVRPDLPPGSTPNALAVSPDGRTLLVANADNNVVAVADVSQPGHGSVRGFIPTGWYPTAVQFSRDGARIFVLSGRGLTSQANPRGPQAGVPSEDGQYAGAMLLGTLSVLPAPDERALAAYTKTVMDLAAPGEPPPAAAASAVPSAPGQRSPIKHLFYVIRENRTYDQILGDLPRGNGDPNLTLFGADVTPNAHALATDFVLLDNFYVNAEVSFGGHSFSTAAYATDFTQKVWPMNYGGRGGRYLSEGSGIMRNRYGNITAPEPGYIWDACVRGGVSVRSYGEFVEHERGHPPNETEQREFGGPPVIASVPGLQGRIDAAYPAWDLKIPDNRRVDIWLDEFRAFEKNGQLPQLSIVRLGNDHTAGTRPGYPTPTAMIAENDLALGRLVETISHSRYWADSAIFVLEDDAQNGPDHVDAHRSPAFAISPYARRGAVDSTLYTTCGMLRTMELILGLPPMSQCDATASPMYATFQSTPVLASFDHRPARVSLEEKNAPSAPGAAASMAMDFSEADRAPDLAFNEIIWRSVRSDPMPPPARAAFVRPIGTASGMDEERRR